MGLNCCCKFLKIIVFLINILITLVGIAVIVLTALVFLKTINSGNEIDSSNDYTVFFKICVAVIVMGSLLTIVGFIGCCGAAFENQFLLGTFVFVMIAALALDVAAVIAIDNNKDTIIKQTEDFVKRIFGDLTTKKIDADNLQKFAECCGEESFNDWKKANQQIPRSCLNCNHEKKPCASNNSSSVDPGLYNLGCIMVMKEKMDSIITYSPKGLAAFGIIETFAMITSLGLCCSIRKAGY